MRVTLENLGPDDLADLEAFTRRCEARRAGPVWEGVGIPRARPVEPAGGLGGWLMTSNGETRRATIYRAGGRLQIQIESGCFSLVCIEEDGEGLPALIRRALEKTREVVK